MGSHICMNSDLSIQSKSAAFDSTKTTKFRFFNFHFLPQFAHVLFFKFYFSLAICFEKWQCKKIVTFLCFAGRALTLVFVDGESSEIYNLYYERSFFTRPILPDRPSLYVELDYVCVY